MTPFLKNREVERLKEEGWQPPFYLKEIAPFALSIIYFLLFRCQPNHLTGVIQNHINGAIMTG